MNFFEFFIYLEGHAPRRCRGVVVPDVVTYVSEIATANSFWESNRSDLFQTVARVSPPAIRSVDLKDAGGDTRATKRRLAAPDSTFTLRNAG